jgi:2-methylcitrate dehydratase PrpD
MKSKGMTRRGFVSKTGSSLAGLAFGAPAVSALSAQPQPRPEHSSPQQSSSQQPSPQQPSPETLAVTQILAKWAVSVQPSEVTEPARKEALRSILNWTGAAVGGAREQAVENAVAALLPYASGGKVRLFGRPEMFDTLRAALLIGISSHVLDFDDADLTTLIHPAGPIASVLFALCQDRRISGADFLHAFILGTEIEGRMGTFLYPSHYAMGWHITGTCGVFGAAAACGRILGLNAQQMAWALGLAASQASGLKIMFGTMTKSFHPGHAAEAGLLAALLAQKGFTASEQAIEGKEGYVFAASTQHSFEHLKDLGKDYMISRNGYKPFPCGIVLHSVLDGMIQLHNEKHPQPGQVKEIALRANPLVLQLTGKKTPETELESKFSVYHAAAVSLLRGGGGVKEFSDEAVKNPAVRSLRSLVHVESDASVRSDEVYITVTLANGTVLTKHVEHALGTLENPMTDAQLDDKFRNLAEGILPPPQIAQMLSHLHHLQELPDVSVILRGRTS